MMATVTVTESYTTTDVQNVVRRFQADLRMFADSSGAMSQDKVGDYVHDVELLARKGYLKSVDVTLLNLGAEEKAARYTVDTASGGIVSDRPGDARWPRLPSARLRVVVSYTSAYDATARQALAGRLRIQWTRNLEDTSHAALGGGGGRNYVSGAYGLKREDWSK